MSLPANTNLLTACQIRAARAMMMKSVRQLATESGISASSIRRMEAVYGVPENVTADLLLRLHAYFEQRGFVFTWSDNAPGVAWGAYPGNAAYEHQMNAIAPVDAR